MMYDCCAARTPKHVPIRCRTTQTEKKKKILSNQHAANKRDLSDATTLARYIDGASVKC